MLALLDAKPALDTELCGRKLGALADVVGEELFDRICDMDLADCAPSASERHLPQPGLLRPEGETLLAATGSDPRLAKLAEIAIALIDGKGEIE